MAWRHSSSSEPNPTYRDGTAYPGVDSAEQVTIPKSNFGYYALTALCIVGTLASMPFGAYWLSLALTVVGVLALGAVDLRGLLVLAYPIYGLVGATLSVALIEDGAYVLEQFRYGYNIGATPLMAAYTLGFLLVAHVAITARFGRRGPAPVAFPSTTLTRFILIAAVVLAVVYLAIFALYGLGLSLATRFEWVSTLPPLIARFHGVAVGTVIPMLFALGMFCIFYFRERRTVLWSLAILVMILIASGDKFSGYLQAITLGLAGLGIAAYARGSRLPFKFSSVFGAVLLSALLGIAMAEGYKRMGSTDVLSSIRERVALQGHVWFGIASNPTSANPVTVADLLRENTLESPGGLDFISYLVSSPSYVYERIARGVSFTMGGPPGILAAFGPVMGLMVFAALGLAYYASVRVVFYGMSNRLLSVACAGLSLYMIVTSATQMGRWDTLYGLVALATYFLILVGWARVSLSAKRRPQLKDQPSRLR